MGPEEREYIRREIASIIDYPSVFMGGPSRSSLQKAGRIIDALDAAGRLCETTCQHDAYDEAVNGVVCPTCGMHQNQTQPQFLFK